MANGTRHIIFDLGGVLIDWDPRYVYNQVFGTTEETEWFLDNICTMEWNVRQDAGRSLAEATRQLQEKHPDWKNEIQMYYSRWEEMLGGAIEPSVDILQRLKQKNEFNLFALTNWSAETFPVAKQRYAFLSWFQGIVVSGEERCIKPDRKIYQTLFDRYKLDPQACLFIDDNRHNVAGALSVGMPALWFESPVKLESQLKELDLL